VPPGRVKARPGGADSEGPMELLAPACIVLYVVVVSAVGVRALLVARRTGRRPERLLGAGSVLVCGVGFPTSVASGFGGLVADVNVPFWVASELVTQLGMLCYYGFTQQVFRPGARFGPALVAAAGLFMLAGLAGAARDLVAADPALDSAQAARFWLLWCFVAYGGTFAWSAFESLRQRGMARRRLALGLADPWVVHVFLLYAIYSLAATGIVLANVVAVLLQRNLATSLVVLGPSAVLGVVAAASISLVVAPPARYRARVVGGAPRGRAAPAG